MLPSPALARPAAPRAIAARILVNLSRAEPPAARPGGGGAWLWHWKLRAALSLADALGQDGDRVLEQRIRMACSMGLQHELGRLGRHLESKLQGSPDAHRVLMQLWGLTRRVLAANAAPPPRRRPAPQGAAGRGAPAGEAAAWLGVGDVISVRGDGRRGVIIGGACVRLTLAYGGEVCVRVLA
ncbi:MAG: hypothetical protein J3K34DRAFT_427272 [Monoraphidium minutum]|nr:MAG: hypothetical protein J3K34DRAFT_427272 [Monoraphidium minutum]